MKSLFLLLLGFFACRTTAPLTDAEKAKLDPALIALLEREDTVEGDYVVSARANGEKQYAVIIRSTRPEELRAAGIPIEAVVGDVITARVTKEELRKLVSLPSVRAVTNSGRDYTHE
ncbi:MAG TPA: hypothetical protein VNL36_01505 [Bacteroidota bacterium]|nr:hypothetical protein [Bacteroidota bacterium]